MELVITPNRAVARRHGLPRYTLEGLAREALARAGLQVASPYRARRLLVQAVQETLAPRDPRGMAAALEGPVRALFRAGADLKQVEEQGPTRAQRVARVAQRYRELLRKEGLLDPAEALQEGARLGEKRPLELLGFPYLGTGELALVGSLAAPGSRVELLQTRGPWGALGRVAGEALKGKGVEVEPLHPSPLGEAFLEGRKAPGGYEVEALRFPDMQGEVRHVLARVKGLLQEGVAPGEIGLVVRDDRLYGPLVRAVAFEMGLPVRLLYRIPLGETRLGGLVALLAEALPHFPYEATLRLLFHPLSPWRNSPDLERIRRLRPHGLEAWREQGLPRELGECPLEAGGQALAEWLRGLLKPLKERVRPWPRERAVWSALMGGLGELEGEKDLEGFLQGLSELLYHLTVPAWPGYGGVELHTPLAAYGGAYRHLFLLGMAEGITPPPLAEDPMLGFLEAEELRRLGVPLETPEEAAAREGLVFAALLSGLPQGSQVVLTYPQVVGSDPVPPSPYLERLGLEARPPGERLVGSWVEARRLSPWEGDPLKEAMERALEAEQARLQGAGGPHAGKTGIPYWPSSLSVSALEDLVNCPFRFLVGHVLTPREDPEAEGDRRGEGELAHRVLARLLKGAVAEGKGEGQAARAYALENLERVFREVETELRREEGFPLLRRPNWPHLRGRLLGMLRRALETNLLPDGIQVQGVELPLEAPLAELGEIPLRGRVDRVDRGSGGPVLRDYKLSATPPRAKHPGEGGLKLDLQLPLYQRLYAARNGGRKPAGHYYLLPKAKWESMRAQEGPLNEALAKAKERLETGSFPPEPGEVCWGCKVRLLCRVGGNGR